MTRVLVIDNYDSFTWNLVHLDRRRSSARSRSCATTPTTVEAIAAARPDAIVLSPGPCTPNEAGICLDLVREAGREIPIFGVCLGLQAIGQAFGGEVVRAPAADARQGLGGRASRRDGLPRASTGRSGRRATIRSSSTRASLPGGA